MDIAQPPDKQTEDGPSTSDKPGRGKRIMLRLDSGALIGHAERLQIHGGQQDSVVCLSMEEAFQRGYVGVAEQERLQRLVSTAQQLPPAVLAAEKPYAAAAADTPFKRVALTAEVAHVAVLPTSIVGRGRQLQDCARVLSYIGKSLGSTKSIFWNRVDEAQAPNYYTIIKHPITLGEIDQKLKTGIYADASEFAADMRQVWENCRLFNRPTDWVYQAGDKASSKFEQRWAEVQRQWAAGITTRPSDAVLLSNMDSFAMEGLTSQQSLEPRRSLRQRIPNSLFGIYDNEEEARAALKSTRGARPSTTGASSIWTADKLDKLRIALNDLNEHSLSEAYTIIMNDPRYTAQDFQSSTDDGIELSELSSDTLRRLDQYLRRHERRLSTGGRPSHSGRKSNAGGSPLHQTAGSAGPSPSKATLARVSALSLEKLGEEITSLDHVHLAMVTEQLRGTPYLGQDGEEDELLLGNIDDEHLAKLQIIVARAWEATGVKKLQGSQGRGAVVLEDDEDDSDDDDEDSE